MDGGKLQIKEAQERKSRLRTTEFSKDNTLYFKKKKNLQVKQKLQKPLLA